MKRIYLDNCSTSYPKAPELGKHISHYIDNLTLNFNRTSSRYNIENFGFLFDLRQLLCTLFHYNHPECVIFTKNITESLNLLIKGYLNKNDHVIISALEHNSVVRPLNQIGVSYTVIPCNEFGFSKIGEIEKIINKRTKAFIINVASNVFGTVQDIKGISEIAYYYHIPLILDTAQSTPYIDIDMESLHVSALAFTGHKGLLGPQGTGGFIIDKDFSDKVSPLIVGGTGSISSSEVQPNFLPDKYSSGTENMPGLYGLNYSLKYIMENLSKIRIKINSITELLLDELKKIEEIRIVGPNRDMDRIGVVSIVSSGSSDKKNGDISSLSDFLMENNIESRVGLHCSPLAHKALGTFPSGTLRFSPGFYTEEDDIYYLCSKIKLFYNSL